MSKLKSRSFVLSIEGTSFNIERDWDFLVHLSSKEIIVNLWFLKEEQDYLGG